MNRERLKLPLSSDNPSPFVQPFLVLGIREKDSQERPTWHVDIGGDITKYLVVDELTARVKPDCNMLQGGIIWMTPLLRQLIDDLATNGLHVEYVGSYHGSAGPSHFLRNGAFFERIS